MAESAVVGVQDDLTGQAVNAFVAIKDGNEATEALRKEFILQVRKSIGPFAAPKAVFIVPDLPKTRSGKIMRRILRKILAGEEDQLGDTTTVCALLYPFRKRDHYADEILCSCRIPAWWTRSLRSSTRHGRSSCWVTCAVLAVGLTRLIPLVCDEDTSGRRGGLFGRVVSTTVLSLNFAVDMTIRLVFIGNGLVSRDFLCFSSVTFEIVDGAPSRCLLASLRYGGPKW